MEDSTKSVHLRESVLIDDTEGVLTWSASQQVSVITQEQQEEGLGWGLGEQH